MTVEKVESSKSFTGSPALINEVAKMYDDSHTVRNFLFDQCLEDSVQDKPVSEVMKLIEQELRLIPN